MRPCTSSSGPSTIQEKNDRAAWSRVEIDRAAGASAVLMRGYCPLHYPFIIDSWAGSIGRP